MNVLVLNCGSSSLDFRLVDTDLERAAEEILIARDTLQIVSGRPPS